MADLRASDADRQRVIDLLREHTAEGRLTLDEFEARVGEALAATTVGDLRHVLRELPVTADPVPAAKRAVRRPRRPIPTPLLIAAVVLAGSLLLGHFAWWLIPVGFWLLGGGSCMSRAACGPARHRREPAATSSSG